MSYQLRTATLDDQPELRNLIERSARQLCSSAYTWQQIEGALRGAFGVDSQLIKDATYFVAEIEGVIVGCGGWSRRRTLFGGDTHTQRDAAELEPFKDAAKIRAFFIDPAHARHGIGRAILQRCELEAMARGFSRFELMATLSGVSLYRCHGYEPGAPIHHELEAGLTIEFVPMSKTVEASLRQ